MLLLVAVADFFLSDVILFPELSNHYSEHAPIINLIYGQNYKNKTDAVLNLNDPLYRHDLFLYSICLFVLV